MNIFFVDTSPQGAARALCDKHIPKMVVETAQMLSTAAWCVLSPPNTTVLPRIYRSAYPNHPSTKWVRSSLGAYTWTWGLFRNLIIEYEFRFNRRHKSTDLLDPLGSYEILDCLDTTAFELPPQCMPDKYKQVDTLRAYRAYYLGDKMRFAKWERGRSAPDWVGLPDFYLGDVAS